MMSASAAAASAAAASTAAGAVSAATQLILDRIAEIPGRLEKTVSEELARLAPLWQSQARLAAEDLEEALLEPESGKDLTPAEKLAKSEDYKKKVGPNDLLLGDCLLGGEFFYAAWSVIVHNYIDTPITQLYVLTNFGRFTVMEGAPAPSSAIICKINPDKYGFKFDNLLFGKARFIPKRKLEILSELDTFHWANYKFPDKAIYFENRSLEVVQTAIDEYNKKKQALAAGFTSFMDELVGPESAFTSGERWLLKEQYLQVFRDANQATAEARAEEHKQDAEHKARMEDLEKREKELAASMAYSDEREEELHRKEAKAAEQEQQLAQKRKELEVEQERLRKMAQGLEFRASLATLHQQMVDLAQQLQGAVSNLDLDFGQAREVSAKILKELGNLHLR